jgi:hypothetical protein
MISAPSNSDASYFQKIGSTWRGFPHPSAGCGAIVYDTRTATLSTIPAPAGTAEAVITGLQLASNSRGVAK